MTKAQLIEMLRPMPDNAIVKAWDPDTEKSEPITGCVHGWDDEGADYEIDFHTDKP